MKIRIKRVDKELPIPSYQTDGAVAFDLYARTTTIIPPWTPTIVPTNLIIEVPKGYFLMLASRSSTPLKKQLMVANGIGVIDEDYHGDNDEIGVQFLNFSKEDVTIERGERIAQALIVQIAKVVEFDEVDSIKAESRGGFGSTGQK
ncbi:MAG: dUTP diphosphatase [Weeksellaceae bacterium]